MKNKLIAAAVISILSTGAFAQQDFHVGVEQITGVKTGCINEFVYYDTSSSTDKLSELNWEINPVWYLGGKADFSYKNISFDFSMAGYIPTICGTMKDSDWQNTYDTSMKTNYSISDNTIRNSFFIESNFAWSFPVTSFFKVAPIFNFKYEYLSFKSQDGEGWYGDSKNMSDKGKGAINVSYDDERAIYYPKGELGYITYDHSNYDFYFGIKPEFSILNLINIELYGAISPFTYIEANDCHYRPNGNIANDWLDSGSTFFKSWKWGGAVTVTPLKQLAFKAGFSFSQVLEYKGEGLQRTSNYYTINSTTKPGFSQYYYDINLSIIYRPF